MSNEASKLPPDPMRTVNIDDGRMLVNSLGAGLALGAGTVGVQQLLKYIRRRAESKKPTEQDIYAPVYDALPLKQAGWEEIKKRLLETKDNALEYVGKNFMPKEMPQIIPGAGATETEPTTGVHMGMRWLLPSAAAIGGAAVGGLGLRSVIKAREDAARNRNAAEAVSAARREYFSAITGESENDASEKSAQNLDAKLNELFDAQKTANQETGRLPWYSRILGYTTEETGRRPWYSRILDYTMEPAVAIPTFLGAGAFGTGALYGGTLAYHKRKAESQRKANEAAEEARARLRGISPPWIDPKELAALKRINQLKNA